MGGETGHRGEGADQAPQRKSYMPFHDTISYRLASRARDVSPNLEFLATEALTEAYLEALRDSQMPADVAHHLANKRHAGLPSMFRSIQKEGLAQLAEEVLADLKSRQDEPEETVEVLYSELQPGEVILLNGQRCKFCRSMVTSFLVYISGPCDGLTITESLPKPDAKVLKFGRKDVPLEVVDIPTLTVDEVAPAVPIDGPNVAPSSGHPFS